MADPDNAARLLEFLQHHDASCPVCHYNLRGLTTPRCPECDHELELAAGATGVRIGWYIAALAPFMSAGLAALALGALLAVAELAGEDPPPVVHLVTLLGLASGAVAAGLLLYQRRFLALAPAAQRRWALVAWLAHGLPFAGLLLLLIATI